MTSLSKTVFNQYHPKKKPVGFQVVAGNTVLFEHQSPGICQKFIKDHAINGKLKGIYK